MRTVKYGKVGSVLLEWLQLKLVLHIPVVFEKIGWACIQKCITVTEVCKTSAGENESFSAEFIWNRKLLSDCQFQYRIIEE